MTTTVLPPLFFATPLANPGESIVLSKEETRHAVGARRLRENDRVVVTDGQGAAVMGAIRTAGRTTAVVVQERLADEPLPTVAVHLLSAVPRGERLSSLLDMATQIGMTSFTPLICERSNHKMPAPDRLQRIMLSAAKQSRRFRVPILKPAVDLMEYLSQPQGAEWGSAHVGLMAHLQDSSSPSNLKRLNQHLDTQALPVECSVLIGPEGGFSDREVTLAQSAGAWCCTLGSHVLRVEAAAVVALTQLQSVITTAHDTDEMS